MSILSTIINNHITDRKRRNNNRYRSEYKDWHKAEHKYLRNKKKR